MYLKTHTSRQSLRALRAFTMMDLMVSMAIISILIAILLPTVGKVRESAQKVICGSNMRQIGMGVSIYTQDNKERLPDSVFLPISRSNAASFVELHRMDTIRLAAEEFPGMYGDLWDGLGLLYADEYITASNIFYCPSHRGNFLFEDAAEDWNRLDGTSEITVNYLFRGMGPDGRRVLYNIDPTAALVTDTLRSYEDLNHQGGFNILQAGLAITWFDDVGDQIAQDILLRSGDDGTQSSAVITTWDLLDGSPDDDSIEP